MKILGIALNKMTEVQSWYLGLLMCFSLPVAYLNFEAKSSTRTRFRDEPTQISSMTEDK